MVCPEFSNSEIKLKFSVQDTGIGIPAGKLKEIFKPFVQADSSTTRQYGGTGLGLSICQKLVQMMRGKLWVESEFGSGTTFNLSLSFSPGEAIQEPESVDPADFPTLSVVVLDDHPTTRQSLCENLNRWGFQSESFQRGHHALEHLQQLSRTQIQNTLILCDVQMLEFDGFRFVEQLREIDRLKDLAIVILTSGLEQGELARFDNAIAQATLRKPFKPSELLDVVLTLASREGASTRQLSLSPELKPMPACRILLVEDGVANQKLISALLGKWGHSVVLATNGREALDRFRPEEFDLILMDIQMPEMDGWEATRRIRELEKTSGTQIPIIAMTAHARDSDREKCLQMGMNGYLSKPIRRQHLMEQLAQWATSATPSRPCRIDWSVARESNAHDEAILIEVARASATELQELSDKLQESLHQENSETSRRYIHTIKSIGRTFGASDLFEISRECEERAAESDLKALKKNLSCWWRRLSPSLGNSMIFYYRSE